MPVKTHTIIPLFSLEKKTGLIISAVPKKPHFLPGVLLTSEPHDSES